MNALRHTQFASLLALVSALVALPVHAQVPVDSSGNPLGDFVSADESVTTGNEGIPLLSDAELEELVGPVALYPDDLLAVVLPASTYPLQLVEAQRFLEELDRDPSLKPDEDWDDSVIAMLNYPEVLELLNEDLDWTWRLGEAVVAQHSDVVMAVETFRDRAYAAGNLESDEHQTVSRSDGVIEITPVDDEIIYVPYYEPERVVVYQPEPVYHYYPTAYPVYYYPYPASHAFNRGFFWGVTTAFTVGWWSDRVHVLHHSYHGHPYYGRRYWDGWWYRRPTVHIHNRYYISNGTSISRHRYTRGDYWRHRHNSRRRLSNQRIARSDYYSNFSAVNTRRATTRTHPRPSVRNRAVRQPSTVSTTHRSQRVAERPGTRTADRSRYRPTDTVTNRSTNRSTNRTADRATMRSTNRNADRPAVTTRNVRPERTRTEPQRESRPEPSVRRPAPPPRRQQDRSERRQEAQPSRNDSERRSSDRRDRSASRGGPSKRRKH